MLRLEQKTLEAVKKQAPKDGMTAAAWMRFAIVKALESANQAQEKWKTPHKNSTYEAMSNDSFSAIPSARTAVYVRHESVSQGTGWWRMSANLLSFPSQGGFEFPQSFTMKLETEVMSQWAKRICIF
jgi:hypothetical protein